MRKKAALMRRKRKSKAERDRERYEAKVRAWELFRPRLAALSCYADVRKLLDDMPLPDTPSRSYYTNLLWFLDTFSPPGASSCEEKRLYIQLAERMDKAGELKSGVFASIKRSVEEAIEERPWE